MPVIKFKFDGISVDLLFARLNLLAVPLDLDLNSVDLLSLTMGDQKSMMSLNGCLVSSRILSLVPNPDVFRVVLRGECVWLFPCGFYPWRAYCRALFALHSCLPLQP